MEKHPKLREALEDLEQALHQVTAQAGSLARTQQTEAEAALTYEIRRGARDGIRNVENRLAELREIEKEAHHEGS